MKNILVIGAGRSSAALINYLLQKASENDWFVTVADTNLESAEQKIDGHQNGKAIELDVTNIIKRREYIANSAVVVSLLPAFLHIEVAKDCLLLQKHLTTASYVSKEMSELNEEVIEKELVFMNELGLDPGLDHLSAMQKIDEIREKGGVLTSFKSYCGGLIAPESDSNPWHYKFTWNPRNVVLAGQGSVAQFLDNGKTKYVTYQQLFKENRTIGVPEMGEYDVYANRDSLSYRKIYGISDIETMLRGTIRHHGFCLAWGALVQLGLTDATLQIANDEDLTYYDLLESFIDETTVSAPLRNRVASFLGLAADGEVMNKLAWLGLFEKDKIGLFNVTPAIILEDILLKKWQLLPTDCDMIIMQHEFEFKEKQVKKRLTSTLVMKGTDAENTAMAKLVGLPLGIFTCLLMQGKVQEYGVNIPIKATIYEPILKELKNYGVIFREKEEIIFE